MNSRTGSVAESIVRRGEVISVVHDRALIRLEPAPGCSACGNRGSCDSGDAKSRLIEMAVPTHAHAGDIVTVNIPAASLSLAAMLGYLLPPVVMLVGAIVAEQLYSRDLAAVVGAALGLCAGVLIARLASRTAFGNVATMATCHSDITIFNQEKRHERNR